MPESCRKSNPCSSAGDSAPASLVVSLLNATLLHLLLLLVIMMEAIECMVGCHFAGRQAGPAWASDTPGTLPVGLTALCLVLMAASSGAS